MVDGGPPGHQIRRAILRPAGGARSPRDDLLNQAVEIARTVPISRRLQPQTLSAPRERSQASMAHSVAARKRSWKLAPFGDFRADEQPIAVRKSDHARAAPEHRVRLRPVGGSAQWSKLEPSVLRHTAETARSSSCPARASSRLGSSGDK